MQESGIDSHALVLLPQLRHRILSKDPAVLFRPDMRRVRWANAAGVEMFGGGTVAGLLAEEFESDHPLIRQFSRAASQIGRGDRIVRGFRISHGGRTQFIQCELQKLALQSDETVTLLTCNDERWRSDLAEHQIAERAIAAFEDCAKGVAIIDLYGLALAADEYFLQMEFTETELERCIGLARQAEGALAQYRLSSADGVERNVVFATIGDRSDRFLVWLSDDTGRPSHEQKPATPSKRKTESEVAASRIDESMGGGEMELDVAADSGAQKRRTATPLKHAAIGKNDEIERQNVEPAGGALSPIRSLLDIWYVGRDEENPAKDEPPEGRTDDTAEAVSAERGNATAEPAEPKKGETERAGESFRFLADADPVRFAWSTNADGIFRSVSAELAQTVGPNAADVVGRSWRDVATVFGFDRTGDIAALMEKRDTWSGKTILWPVQGTDLAVPVDLAALPAFESTRAFDGFRGYGIIRTADAVVDPDELGLTLASVATPLDTAATGDNDPSNASLDASEAGESGYSGNVVNLPSKRANSDSGEGLSGSEAQAFAEIGRTLVESESGTEATVDDATGAGELDSEGEVVLTNRINALDVPAIVVSQTELVLANERMLEAAGYASLEEIVEAGGIENMFEAQETVPGSRPVMMLKARDGKTTRVNPWIQSVRWSGSPALLMTFTPLAEGERQDQLARLGELENILDTATDGILLIDDDGRIESGNASAEALFGRPLSEVAGEPLSVLFAPECLKTINDYLADLTQPGVAGILNDGREVIGLEANGGLIPLFVTIGRNGDSRKYSVVLRDITQWKKAEEELVTARRVAETASEQKTEFLARVSHEIRTPLNAIIGFSEVMLEERFGPIGNERYREYLRDINRSGVHVLDLINDLLDISKIEAGKMDLSYEAVDLNQVVSETVALLQPQANGERIIIRTSLSRAVPKVVADVRSMRQIILNLVSNAIKFTPMNGQVIVSTVYEGNGEVVLRVRDTGRGMSQGEIEHAMKPFSQINVTNEKRGQGTGLGLPLTKALVEANRAYFDLESAPGEGTIAHVHFPTQRVLAD